MSEEMTSRKSIETNYIKLAQIYHVLKNDRDDACDKVKDKTYYVLNYNKVDYYKAWYWIKTIIDNDFDINYKLSSNSLICEKNPHYSGNAVSHFIVELVDDPSCLFEELIECDIGLTIQNDNGYTPLLLAFMKDMKIDKILDNYIKKKILNNFYSKQGLSHFHVACTTSMTEIIDHYLKTGVSVNEPVNDDLPKFGGYTPLHFAIEYCQPQMIEFLLKNGASLNNKDSNGMTPLHLLMNKLLLNEISKDDQIQKFLQDAVSNNLFNLPDDVGFTLTHLKSILETFKNEKEITNIDAPINLDSSFFPGYTPLHFAAHLNLETVTLLLEAGADILIKDKKGITPFDLCLKKFNINQIIKLFLVEKRHKLSKLKFTNGVIILNVLQAMQKDYTFENYLKQKFKDVNDIIPLDSPIWPGCSLLHLVVIFDGPVDKILACPNINFEIQDAKGMNPLHIAFHMKKVNFIKILLCSLTFTSSYPNDSDNLSYLHIACALYNVPAIWCLLNKGADPNLPTLCDIQWKLTEDFNLIKAGSTPLHIAVQTCKDYYDSIVNVLMEYEAKPNVADANGITSYHIALEYQYRIIFDKMLKSDKDFYTRKEYEKLGLTRLQMACFIRDLSMVKEELASGADVNKQISFDSKILPGDTALHILCRSTFKSRNEFIELLLAHGANPCLTNARNVTPVLFSRENLFGIPTHLLGNNFYSQNPLSNDGMSHFHVACIANNLLAAENFLKSGISVNEPIDYFADLYAGFTPLHLAVWNDSVELIELLFNYGADPNIKSANGYTPLHLSVLGKFNDSLQKLLSYPAVDIQVKNTFGDAALEIGIQWDVPNEHSTKFLLEKGACLSFAKLTEYRSGTKLISRAMKTIYDNEIFRKLIANGHDITISDDEGNNLIHHIASENYFYFSSKNAYEKIQILVDHGCELDHKNNEGKTPLHFAVSSENHLMCEALLDLGADINIIDDDKKTPYFYHSNSVCKLIIIKHTLKLESVGFYIDDLNRLDSDARDFYKNDNNYYYDPFFLEIYRFKIAREKELLDSWLKKEINPTFSATYIFSNQFLKDFKSIPESQRQKILIESCRSEDEEDCYPVLQHLIKVQFNRAQKWNRLFVPAANSFQVLSGLAVSEMCLEIVKHLDIGSLMNLVRAVNGKLEYPPLIENN